MPNKFQGICYKCGNVVEPGAGVFERVSKTTRKKWPNLPHGTRWQTQHHECVRDYASDAHHVQNQQPPLVVDAKWQPAWIKAEART